MDRFQEMLGVWIENGNRRISMRMTQGRDGTAQSKGEGEVERREQFPATCLG